jgi:ADP-heptose:LPS heptosyltransferase
VPAFIFEQILADIRTIGLADSNVNGDFLSFLPWKISDIVSPFPGGQRYIVLHTGAKDRWTTTRWPIEKWIILIKRILEEKDYAVCLVGTSDEEIQINKIAASFSEAHRQRIILCCSWPLKEISSLIASSDGVVCHNSGILHLSTFLKKNTVCITGSSAKYWRPLYPCVTNVTSNACKLACNKYRCPVPFFRAKCIRKISVDDVWKNIIDNIMDKALIFG